MNKRFLFYLFIYFFAQQPRTLNVDLTWEWAAGWCGEFNERCVQERRSGCEDGMTGRWNNGDFVLFSVFCLVCQPPWISKRIVFSFLLCKLNLFKSSNYLLLNLLPELKGQSFSRLLCFMGIIARVCESGKVVRVLAAKPNLSNFNFFFFSF